jgi:IS1 family transposase
LKTDTRLWLAHVEGDRSTAHASQLFQKLEQCRSPDSSCPLVSSDSWDAFKAALLEVYGTTEPLSGVAFKGKIKTYRALPHDLAYVRIRKIRHKKKLVRVERQIVFGHPRDIQERLAASQMKSINTSYVERFNGTIRNSLARFIRKTMNASKQMRMHQACLDFLQAWYNFIKPHYSLRLAIDHPRKKWLQRTPAMAEGLTDRIWTLDELLSFRVPIHL